MEPDDYDAALDLRDQSVNQWYTLNRQRGWWNAPWEILNTAPARTLCEILEHTCSCPTWHMIAKWRNILAARPNLVSTCESLLVTVYSSLIHIVLHAHHMKYLDGGDDLKEAMVVYGRYSDYPDRSDDLKEAMVRLLIKHGVDASLYCAISAEDLYYVVSLGTSRMLDLVVELGVDLNPLLATDDGLSVIGMLLQDVNTYARWCFCGEAFRRYYNDAIAAIYHLTAKDIATNSADIRLYNKYIRKHYTKYHTLNKERKSHAGESSWWSICFISKTDLAGIGVAITEWRPHLDTTYPLHYRNTTKTLLLLAKITRT